MNRFKFKLSGGSSLDYDPTTGDVTVITGDVDIHSDDLNALIKSTGYDTLEFIDLNNAETLNYISEHFEHQAQVKQIEFDNALLSGDHETSLRLATLKIKYAMIARNILS